MERNRGGRPRHPDVLTPAEWRVLEALREGGTNAEIGARLGISADAVKYHVSNMLGKLELRDRRALAAWRPEERRGRLPAWFAVPAALTYVARPLVWVGLGTAAAVGVTVTVVAAVVAVAVVLVVVPGNGDPSTVALPPVATPEAASTPAAVATVEHSATPTATPTSTVTPTATPDASATPRATTAPSPTPTVSPTPEPGPAATTSPSPTPTATPQLEAAPTGQLADLIQPAPAAFEQRTFVSGERIDWSEGIFLMDPETGQIQGYRLADWEERADVRGFSAARQFLPSYAVYGSRNRWITTRGSGPNVLLDRARDAVWRLPDHLELITASQDRLLLRDTRYLDGDDVLADTEFNEIGTLKRTLEPQFSPDGRHLLLAGEGTVSVFDLEAWTETVLYQSAAHPDWGMPARVTQTLSRAGEEILVHIVYEESAGGGWQRAPREWRRFNWDAETLSTLVSPIAVDPDTATAYSYAPDGRHVVRQEEGYDIGFYEAGEAWPSVVVADAATGEPLFRVRSASLQFRGDSADWLATGDGLVLRTAPTTCGQTGPVLLRIRPEPEIERLPDPPTGCPGWPFREGTIIAPAEGGRYFAEAQAGTGGGEPSRPTTPTMTAGISLCYVTVASTVATTTFCRLGGLSGRN